MINPQTKSFPLIMLYLLTISCANKKIFSHLTEEGFKKLEQSYLFRRDINTEILLLSVGSDFSNFITKSNLKIAAERGLIKNFENSNVEGFKMIKFNQGPYFENRIIAKKDANGNLFVFSMTAYSKDSVIDKMQNALKSMDWSKIRLPILDIEEAVKRIQERHFRVFDWSDKSRYEMYREIKNQSVIKEQQIRNALDAYQIASGHNTGVGQIKALKQYITEHGSMTIDNWVTKKNITLNSISELNELIQSYDPVIDIVNDEEFKSIDNRR